MQKCYVYDTFRGSVIYIVIYRKLTLSDKSYSLLCYTFLISTEMSSTIHKYLILKSFSIDYIYTYYTEQQN